MDETLFWLVLTWSKFDEEVKKQLAPIDPELAELYLTNKVSMSDTLNNYVLKYGEEAKKLINAMSIDFENRFLDRVVPNPELVDFVRENSKRYKMYIWTSNTSKVAGKILVDYGLADAFVNIASQLEVRLLKPEPDGFAYLREQNVPLSEYLMIGNSAADQRAAAAAGIDFFHIDYFTKTPQAD